MRSGFEVHWAGSLAPSFDLVLAILVLFPLLRFPKVALGRGLLFSIFINENHPEGRVTASKLAALLLRRGILTSASGNKIRIGPPLVIKEEDLWYGLGEIEKAVKDLEEGLGEIASARD